MASQFRRSTIAAAAVITIGVVGGAWLLTSGGSDSPETDVIAVEAESGEVMTDGIVVPELSGLAVQGRLAFGENCGGCHGANGGGTNQGPPLIHPIYEPNHHSDMAFVLAARNGSRAHHWRFGDMPPQPQVNEADITAIIQFVREVQRANGIF